MSELRSSWFVRNQVEDGGVPELETKHWSGHFASMLKDPLHTMEQAAAMARGSTAKREFRLPERFLMNLGIGIGESSREMGFGAECKVFRFLCNSWVFDPVKQ